MAATIARVRTALEGRRTSDDPLHPADLRRDDAHVSRHRILAARHIAADRLYRNALVAEDDPGDRLDFEVLGASLLLFRKILHLRLGEIDFLRVAWTNFREGVLDLRIGQPERRRRPLSNFSDNSRTAASPCFAMSARIASTVVRTTASPWATLRDTCPASGRSAWHHPHVSQVDGSVYQALVSSGLNRGLNLGELVLVGRSNRATPWNVLTASYGYLGVNPV